MKKNVDISFKKLSLDPWLYRGSTVLNFIYFSKSWGGSPGPSLAPPPPTGPANENQKADICLMV